MSINICAKRMSVPVFTWLFTPYTGYENYVVVIPCLLGCYRKYPKECVYNHTFLRVLRNTRSRHGVGGLYHGTRLCIYDLCLRWPVFAGKLKDNNVGLGWMAVDRMRGDQAAKAAKTAIHPL